MNKYLLYRIRSLKMFKIAFIIFFILAGIALIVGVSFHGYRMDPTDSYHYNLGVAVGIYMIVLFILFLVMGITFLIVYECLKHTNVPTDEPKKLN
ncbi:MAG: hypothetical protein WC174_04700 [Bacilli bacterium]